MEDWSMEMAQLSADGKWVVHVKREITMDWHSIPGAVKELTDATEGFDYWGTGIDIENDYGDQDPRPYIWGFRPATEAEIETKKNADRGARFDQLERDKRAKAELMKRHPEWFKE